MGKTNKHKLKELVAVLAGNVFEFYAFILFVMCAPYISKVFFTPDDPNGLILVYCISFCGYFSRPLGALVIGHFADQYSRKLALSVTVFSMGAVTFSIGLLPSYSVAGYLGASLLVILRFCQGFLVSGEEGSAVVYLSEAKPSYKNGFVCGLVLSSVFSGIFVGSSICSLCEFIFSQEEMISYGWRIPFFMALPMAAIVRGLRKNIRDSSCLDEHCRSKTEKKIPAREIFSFYKMDLLRLTLVCAVYSSLTCLVMVWLPNELKGEVPRYAFSAGLIYMMLLIPVFGVLNDAVGAKPLLITGLLLTLCLIQSIMSMINGGEYIKIIIGLFMIYTITVFVSAPIFPLLVERFPADVRCSGVSFVFNLAVSLFSGVFPAVSSFIVSYYGVDGVTYLLVAIVFISIFALLVHNPRVKKSYKLMLANS